MSNDTKKPETDIAKLVADITKSIMNESLPAMAAAMAGNKPASQPVMDTGRGRTYGPVCTTCGQYVTGCNNEHENMAVYTVNYPEFGEFFQGVRLNGVNYLSNNENHPIPVPKAAATYITQIIKQFEHNERECRIGRQKTHNSGHIANPQAASAAWR